MAVSVITVLINDVSSAKDGDIMMEGKVKKGVVPILLLVSVLVTAQSISVANATNSSTWGVGEGQSAQWLITSSSNVTTMWYSETFSPRGNFSAPLGSVINVTISSVSGSRLSGDISIGQLALDNVSMSEISFNLLLGWYPFQPGLVCPINWDVQKQNATSNGFTLAESRTGGLDVVTFKHLLGNEGTILVYDKSTGLLIDGYGAFGQFLIEVGLISTDIDVGSVQSSFLTLGLTYMILELATIVVAVCAVLILRDKLAQRSP